MDAAPAAGLTTTARPSGARLWLLAARPATLSAAVVPVLVGTGLALAAGAFDALLFAATLTASVLIQVGTNLANDLFDHRKGADTAERLGPPRVTSAGLATPRAVAVATVATFALATLLGIYLIAVGGWPILVIGVASIAAGVLYTGGPWPLGYHGLGELFVFIFFGPVPVLGTYYLQTGRIDTAALVASLPVGCVVTAIVVINNLRDIATDRAVGKRTVAVRIGDRATRVEYVALVAAAYALLLAVALVVFSPWPLLALLSLPLAYTLARRVRGGASGRDLNVVLKRTGQLHLVFGALFAVGLAMFERL